MEDIRAIEKETQALLKKRMANDGGAASDDGEYKAGYDLETDLDVTTNNTANTKAQFCSIEYSEADVPNIIPKSTEKMKRKSLSDTMEEEDEDDEFFDCREQWDEASSLAKWSSMELENLDGEAINQNPDQEPQVSFRRVQSLHERSLTTPVDLDPQPLSARPYGMMSRPLIDVNQCSQDHCPTQVLILVVHGGSVLDGPLDASVRKSDVMTFRGAFETLMRTHYPGLLGQVAVRCVPCPSVCTEALAVLSSLSPYRYKFYPIHNHVCMKVLYCQFGFKSEDPCNVGMCF